MIYIGTSGFSYKDWVGPYYPEGTPRGEWLPFYARDFNVTELNLGFCCVDQPRLKGLIPTLAEATSTTAYVRFHGRNAKKWWQHDEAWERYDYSYTDEELEEWVPKLRKLEDKAENTFVFANNHWQGQAVQTARQLRMLLTDLEPRG
jgi:uncharacterized protein YecE (DUF72 family)